MEKDAPNRFKEWFNELNPEEVKLPLDWKRLDQPGQIFQKLLVLRCLRPDRMAAALGDWIRNTMVNGRDFMDCDGSSAFFEILTTTFEDSTNITPIFFILSPGADPVKEVEKLGKKLIGLQNNVNYHNVAMATLTRCRGNGQIGPWAQRGPLGDVAEHTSHAKVVYRA